MTQSNTYRTPTNDDAEKSSVEPVALVSGPAIGLISTSIFSIVCLVISFCLSSALLFTGLAEQLPNRNGVIDRETTIMIRLFFNAVVTSCNVVTLLGALKMRNLGGYRFATIGATLACIPCVVR